MTGLAFVQTVCQPVDRFRGFAVARQDGFERLDFRRLGGAGQGTIGSIGIDDPALAVGDQRAVLMAVEEGARQLVRTRLRHDLDEADDRGHQKENPDHGQHTENAQHDLVS